MNGFASTVVAYVIVGVLLWGYVAILAIQRLRQR
jgi:hypothetical protein